MYNNVIVTAPPRDKPRKKYTPTIYLLPELANCDNTTEGALNKIKELLDKLCITHKLLDKRGNNVTLDIVANTNTWSNQRRKRRLQKIIEAKAKVPKLNSTEDITVNNTDNGNQIDNVSTINVDESCSSQKQLHDYDHHEQLDGSTQTGENEPLVHAFLKFVKKEKNILLEVEYLSGNAGKEGLHQIMQYVKNNWK